MALPFQGILFGRFLRRDRPGICMGRVFTAVHTVTATITTGSVFAENGLLNRFLR